MKYQGTNLHVTINNDFLHCISSDIKLINAKKTFGDKTANNVKVKTTPYLKEQTKH